MLAAITPCSPPKCSSSFWRRRGPDGRDLLEARGGARLAAARAMAGDGEAVRLVADLLDEVQRRMVGRQAPRLLLAREEELLHARACAPRPWPRRSSRIWCRPRSAITPRAALSCPRPPSMRIRSGVLPSPVGELAVAPLERVAHGGVVVARLDALHVVAPVLGVLHRALVVDHARGDGRLAHGVADVEALDALRSAPRRRGIPAAPPTRASCVACAESRWPMRERGVLARHVEPRARLAHRAARRPSPARPAMLAERAPRSPAASSSWSATTRPGTGCCA